MARLFNGTSDSVDFSAAAALNLNATATTLLGWGKPETFTDTAGGLVTGSNAYILSVVTSTLKPRLTLPTVYDYDATTVTLTNNVWQHLACVLSGNGTAITSVRFVLTALDGTQTAETVTSTQTPATLTAAGENIGGSYNWKGRLGHVGIWSGVGLSDAEIKTVAGALTHTSKAGCDAYWPLTGADPELDTADSVNSTNVRATTWVADPVPAWTSTRANTMMLLGVG